MKKLHLAQMWEIDDERYNPWYSLNHTTINYVLIKPAL